MEDSAISTEIVPASAGWAVDYIVEVDLNSEDGTNIPLYNKSLYYECGSEVAIVRKDGDESEYFVAKNEDYWLFKIHSNHAEFEIAIGGETPVLVNSKPNWKKCTDEETDVIWKSCKEMDPGSCTWHDSWYQSWVVYEDEAKGEFDRFVAVRCPKMDNPAITIKGSGHFACLHWVGLFLKSTTNKTNKFIAVETTNQLLPKYAKRNRNAGYDWFRDNGPADITDRTLTIFPKQLYGTSGSDPDLYDRFITIDPDNIVGQKHLELVRSMVEQKSALSAYKYTWHASGRTLIKTSKHDEPDIYPVSKLNYVSGLEVIRKKVNGWAVLLTVFMSVTKITAGLLTTNFASIVAGIFDMKDIFDEKKMMETADLNGFITAVAKGVDDYNKKFPGDKKKTPNTSDVPTIKLEIHNNTVLCKQFGTSA
ncbi:uncharacterized protein N7498_008768 [Penicillium cinerascens]|uniref:Uncharacterized protein n=1 Tax=Penicillium cinerascens TaxID=70096 RepID=A0A9W9JI55_9EURO|nr:uncharacterized protein N7498_008768 [Penicillium cinerascens]KAJ5195330.1 hypothetical protein N7498_008768 [Penicillium cinerascens]